MTRADACHPEPAQRAGHLAARLRSALAGRYRLLRELGRGGTGVVYLARAEHGGPEIALKVLWPALARDPARREAFVRQAGFASQFLYRNVVTISEAEEAGDFVWFTMDYVNGATLAQRVRAEGPLAADEANRILRIAAAGVGQMHRIGWVHGDLHPGNLMCEHGTGRVVIMDPGITPAATSHARPDLRGDVQALGAAGYFAVTGSMPWEGGTPPGIFEVCPPDKAPALRVYGPLGDTGFAHAVGRCLCADADARFSSAEHLADWLMYQTQGPGPGVPEPLRYFLTRLRWASEDLPISAMGVGLALQALVASVAQQKWNFAFYSTAGMIWLAFLAIERLLESTAWAFLTGYTPVDLLRVLRQEVERARHRLLLPRGTPAGGGVARLIRRLAGVFRGRRRRVPMERWLGFWGSAPGRWLMGVGSWLGRRRPVPPTEIAILFAPSFEEMRREASRDLVNRVPAMRHFLAARLARIQERMDAGGVGAHGQKLMTESAAQLRSLVRRLRAVRYGANRERLDRDLTAAHDACRTADLLLEAP